MQIGVWSGNYPGLFGKNGIFEKSSLLDSLSKVQNSPEADPTEAAAECKEKLSLLDRIKADDEHLLANVRAHFRFMTGFSMIIKERLKCGLHDVETLMDERASAADKKGAQDALEDNLKMIDGFSKAVAALFEDCDYITDGKLLEVSGGNPSVDKLLFSMKDLNFAQWGNLEDVKRSFERAIAKTDRQIEALKEMWADLKAYYTGQAEDRSAAEPGGDREGDSGPNAIKYTLMNILLKYATILGMTPEEHPLGQRLEQEGEALRRDLLKTDLRPGSADFSALNLTV